MVSLGGSRKGGAGESNPFGGGGSSCPDFLVPPDFGHLGAGVWESEREEAGHD